MPQPHEKLWFDRGDVVLFTEKYLFKVHKDILSLHSSVFKDMFDFPGADEETHVEDANPAAGTSPDSYEGIPLVRLSGDDGEDVAHLLRTVYERKYYQHEGADTPLQTVIALLILSTKYDFKLIRTEVIAQIARQYPMKLDEFDGKIEQVEELFGEDWDECHFRLLKALFTSNVDSLLPQLYYACSHQPLDFIFTQAELLGPECLSVLVQGRNQLEAAINTLIADLPDYLFNVDLICLNNCAGTTRVTCLKHFLGNTNLFLCDGEDVVKHCIKNICERCAKPLVKKFEEARHKIWDDIPEFFGLPRWDVLRQNLHEICPDD